MKINEITKHKVEIVLGKVRQSEITTFPTYMEATKKYNALTQMRGEASRKLFELEMKIENVHTQLKIIDSALEAYKYKYSAIKAEANKEYIKQRDERMKDVEKGVVKGEVFVKKKDEEADKDNSGGSPNEPSNPV